MSDFGKPRNPTKAIVRREARDGREVVVKDYAPRPAWVRILHGRRALRREARAYARLANVRGVPRCLGFDGPDTLVLELVPGRSLGAFEPGELSPALFEELDRVVRDIHARGVAIADLHRSNVLVEGSSVHVVDFAVALIARDAARPGWLVRQLQQLDRHAAARLRARYLGLPEPHPAGLFGAVYRLARTLRR